MSERVEQFLEQILGELITIRQALTEEDVPASPSIPDFSPIRPLPVPPPMLLDRCARCGISLSGAMGYVCSDPHCPTGFGSVVARAGG